MNCRRMLRRIKRDDCSIPEGFTYKTTIPVRKMCEDGFYTEDSQEVVLTGRWKVLVYSPEHSEVLVGVTYGPTLKYVSEVDVVLCPKEYLNFSSR